MLVRRKSPGPAPTQRGGRLGLFIFPLGHLVNDWPSATLWLLAPAVALSMDLTPAEVGLLISIHGAVASVGYLPAGLLGDRFPNRAALLAGTFFWVAVGYFAASLMPGFWSLALMLAAAGVGSAAWHPIATAAMVEHNPARRAQLIGVHALGGTLAEVGAPALAGFLLASLPWQTVLQLSALPALVMGAVFLKLRAHLPRARHSHTAGTSLRALIDVWRRPRALRLTAIVSIYNVALMGALAMLPLFAQRVHGFSAAEAGILFAGAYLLGAVGQPLLGHVSDALGRKGVTLSVMLGAAVSFGWVVAVPGPISSSLALVLGIGLLASVRAVLLAAMVDHAGGREATTLGFGFAMMDGVGALGAWFAGIAGSVDLHHAFGLTAIAALVAAVLVASHNFNLGGAVGPVQTHAARSLPP